MRYPLPLLPKLSFRKFLDSRLLSNRITEARLENATVAFSGEIGFLSKAEEISEVRLVVRSGKGREVSEPCVVSELELSSYGGDLFHLRFRWGVSVFAGRLEVFPSGDLVNFYIAFRSGEEIRESKFGHLRSPGVFDQFASNAMLYNQLLLCPTETKWNNFCIRLNPLEKNVCLPLEIKLDLLSGGEVMLSVRGKKGFDNYKESKASIVLALPNGEEVVEDIARKPKRRGYREIAGSIAVASLPVGRYRVAVRHYVRDGSFDQKSFICDGGSLIVEVAKKTFRLVVGSSGDARLVVRPNWFPAQLLRSMKRRMRKR